MKNYTNVYKCSECGQSYDENTLKKCFEGFNYSVFYGGERYNHDAKTFLKGVFLCDSCKESGKKFSVVFLPAYICRGCGMTTLADEVGRKKSTNDTIITDGFEEYNVQDEEIKVLGSYLCLHCQGIHTSSSK
jgi:hypothetical protein